DRFRLWIERDRASGAACISVGYPPRAHHPRGRKQSKSNDAGATTQRCRGAHGSRGEKSRQRKAAEPEKESGGVCDERCGDERHGELLLSASSERYVILRAMARVLVDATHRIEHQHGHLGSCLVARKRD